MDEHLTYLAYGLRLSSNYPLPFLPRTTAKADCTIHYAGSIAPLAEPPPYPQVWWHQEGEDWLWEYREPDGMVLKFLLPPSGNSIKIRYSRPEMGDIFSSLLGPGLGAALHLRNIPLLHGASVVMKGSGILVPGQSGRGKSTLTAMLVAAGLPLLTEDLTPLDVSGPEPRILPGYPGLQLHADAIAGLNYSLEDCPPVYPGVSADDKHWIDINRLRGGFHSSPAPLRIIYLLTGRRADLRAPEVKPLAPTQACLALLEHLYGSSWLNIPSPQALALCARLAEGVRVCRVWTPEGLDTIAATAQALMEDAQSNVGAAKPRQKGIL